jgi:hypothetical protein
MKYLALIFLFLIAFAKSGTVFKFRNDIYEFPEMEIQISDEFLIKNGEKDFESFDIDVKEDLEKKLEKNHCLAYEHNVMKIYQLDLAHEACDEVKGYVNIEHLDLGIKFCCFKQFTYYLLKSDGKSVELKVNGI